MTHKFADCSAEMRDTVMKSSLTGVAATVLAVAAFSPAGFGGVIGTSMASGSGSPTSNNVYGELPPFPSPVSAEELSEIRSELAQTGAVLDSARAATDANIERVRSIAASEGLAAFVPMSGSATAGQIGPSQPTATAMVPISPAAAQLTLGSSVLEPEPRDANLELAALLLAHENI